MSDFAPPPGPPPPKVPQGWKAIWNSQYNEWFYVNIYTKQSQWDKPQEPVYPPGEGSSSDAPPPSYGSGPAQNVGSEKAQYNSNNPFGDHNTSGAGPANQMSEDEKLARKLQDEENTRSGGASGKVNDRGESDSYYSQAPAYGQGGSTYGGQSGAYPQQSGAYPSQSGSYPQQNELPPRPEQKKGLLGKLFNKTSSSQQPQYGYGQQQPMHYGGYAAPHGYPPGGMYAQRPQRHGMGAGTGAALGLGGGLLGGMLLGEALEDHHGGDDGGYGGGDDGGGFGGDGESYSS